MIKEGNPISLSGFEAGLKRNGETRKAREIRQAGEIIFRMASNEDLTRLTGNQRHVLDLNFPPGGKGLNLEKAGEELGVTGEAIRQTRNGGIKKLERLQRGESIVNKGWLELEMDSNTRELLVQTSHLSEHAHCKMFRRSNRVVARWRGEVGIKKNPVGRPRKSDPSS